jgi:hypothetical protein
LAESNALRTNIALVFPSNKLHPFQWMSGCTATRLAEESGARVRSVSKTRMGHCNATTGMRNENNIVSAFRMTAFGNMQTARSGSTDKSWYQK